MSKRGLDAPAFGKTFEDCLKEDIHDRSIAYYQTGNDIIAAGVNLNEYPELRCVCCAGTEARMFLCRGEVL